MQVVTTDQDFKIGKSTNRKVLGAMSSLTNDLYYSLGIAGGIGHADETDINARLVWTLIGKPRVKPIEELKKRIPGIRTSFDPLASVRMLPANALTGFIRRTDSLIGELGHYGLRGFLFAVLTAPEMIMPSKWTEMLLGGGESHFAGPEHAMKVMGLIHEEYNEINEAILDGVGVRPDHCPLRADAMANALMQDEWHFFLSLSQRVLP